MRTADFLPPQEFETHLERRKTPKRLITLGALTLVAATIALAVKVEAAFQEAAAVNAEAPNEHETAAGLELKELYAQMNAYVGRLDPLADHLRMPASGRVLAGLGKAVGEYVQIERIDWEHDIRRKGTSRIESAEMHMVLTALVRGDRTLLELPGMLKEFTGFENAYIGDQTELVLDMPDTVRAEIHLTTPLVLPQLAK